MKTTKCARYLAIVFCIILLSSTPFITGVQRVLANNASNNSMDLTKVNLSDGIVTWIPTGSFDMSSFARVSRMLPDSFPKQDSDLNLLTVRNG